MRRPRTEWKRQSGIVLLDLSVFWIHALRADLVWGAEQDIVWEIRESLETGGTTEEPVARAAQALREDRARGQVRRSEWSEGGRTTHVRRTHLHTGRQRPLTSDHVALSRLASCGASGVREDVGTHFARLLVASDGPARRIVHSDVQDMPPEQGNSPEAYR